MKKVLLFVFALTLSAGMYAQKPQVLPGFAKKAPAPFHQQVASEPIGTKPVYMAPVVQSPSSPDGPNAVSIIDLGTSINPFGMSGAGRTVLWADNQINAIGFVHRMNGDVMAGASIAFDLSKDGGASWSNNIKVYAPLGPPLPGQTYPQAAGRYPQGCLYNPAGNTDPRNAYMHYFIPTLDGSNPGSAANAGSWGGYAFGVRKADTIPPYTQHNVPSGNGYLHNIPDAFALVGNKTFIVEPSLFGGLGTNYSDSLVVSKGVWNATTNDFDYTFDKLYVPCDWYVTDSRIAFAPNGQIGYISILSHNTSKPLTDSTYFPILYKTINGGTTWTGPINVDLYGTNGVPEVKQYVSDSLLTAMFTTMPDRDSIAYGTIGASDLNVDVNGNPHIACVVNLASGTYTTYYPKTCQMFDIYSPDGGTTWKGISLDTISNEWGTYGTGATTVSDDNRPQISRSEDGSRMFISWLDTQPPTSPAANTAPNIFVRGINVWTSMMTPVLNVTKFTLAIPRPTWQPNHLLYSRVPAVLVFLLYTRQ